MTEPKPTYTSEGEQITPAVIAELRIQLMQLRRDALAVVKTAELAMNIPPDQSAIRNRAERRGNIPHGINGGYVDNGGEKQ